MIVCEANRWASIDNRLGQSVTGVLEVHYKSHRHISTTKTRQAAENKYMMSGVRSMFSNPVIGQDIHSYSNPAPVANSRCKKLTCYLKTII